MRRILKGIEPPSLEAHRNDTCVFPNWDNFRGKQQSREHALVEQRAVCAFCQVKIVADEKRMKLAHIVPQKDLVDGKRLDLVWTNIVGACPGGERTPRHLQHCDTRQANRRLHPELDPVQFTNGSLTYDKSGGVYRADGNLDVQDQLDDVLGLNLDHIKEKRVAALRALKSYLAESADRERWLQDRIALLDPDNPSDQPLLEYADFLLWHLRFGELAMLT